MRSVVLYCPHLDRDLRGLCEKVPDLLIHVGLQTSKGEDGCLEGHKSIIREAMGLGEDKVFVMEDDCVFTQHFDYHKWVADAEWAQSHGYDVLVGGSTRTYDEKPTDYRCMDTRMIEVSAFHSAHCVVCFKSGYEKVMNAVQPYDLSLGRDCGMRCVLAWPFVAVQAASFSGILKQNVDYVPLYAQHEQQLGRMRGLT